MRFNISTITGNGTRDDELVEKLAPKTDVSEMVIYLVIKPVSYAGSDLDHFRSEKVYDERVMVFVDRDEAYTFARETGCAVRELLTGITYNLAE